MSLSVVLATPHSLWTLVDREISAAGETILDASKIVCLDATDGIGLLSYAGNEVLGGEDPSEWAASVFQGLDTDFEGYMRALTAAATKAGFSNDSGHLFVAAGVVDGTPAIYTIASNADGELELRRHAQTYAFMLAGPRGPQLAEERTDGAEIVDWMKKVETGEAHPREVADRLVKWNGEEADARAIIACRMVADGEATPSRYYYDGGTPHAPDAKLAHMSRGTDLNEVMELMKKQAMGVTLTMRETAQVLTYKRRMAESESD